MITRFSERTIHWSCGCYRLLLYAYPAGFRTTFGSEMLQVFESQMRHCAVQAGKGSALRLWGATLFDLVVSAGRERIFAMRMDRFTLLMAVLAIVLGWIAGRADLRNDDVQGPVLLILIFGFLLGVLRPKTAWLSGALVGLMIPTIHFIAQARKWPVNFPTNSSTPYWAFLALIPALAGAFAGSFTRRALHGLMHRAR
jgi:hypothetical protein